MNMKLRLHQFLCAIFFGAVIVLIGDGCSHAIQHSAYREIHGAARDGDFAQVAGDLAQNPGGLNLPDDAGLTPLHLAASYCHTNVMSLLLNKGANIDPAAKDGATPLHLAAQEGCPDAVNLLIFKGAQVNARDNQKRTPLTRAQQWHQDAIVQLLRDHGGTE
jgi:ankyrin repeat protein